MQKREVNREASCFVYLGKVTLLLVQPGTINYLKYKRKLTAKVN